MTHIFFAAAAASIFAFAPALADDHGGHAHGGHADDGHTMHAANDAPMHEDIAAALEAGGSLVTAEVNGMVCDFCATAMTRTFGRRDEVAAVHVDLDAKVLQVVVKAGESLTDETIRDLVMRAGYETTAIRRGVAE
jgi:copper chaperone CopZ